MKIRPASAEWPLLDLPEVLPRGRLVSPEVPRLARAGSEAQLREYLGECVQGARGPLKRRRGEINLEFGYTGE